MYSFYARRSQMYFFRFWDLWAQKLCVECWWNRHMVVKSTPDFSVRFDSNTSEMLEYNLNNLNFWNYNNKSTPDFQGLFSATLNPMLFPVFRCQFHQHFICTFFLWRFVQSQTLSREKLLKRLSYKKCVCKILMKLTPELLKLHMKKFS